MGKIIEKLRQKKVLLSDGAWGTFVYKKGLKPGECPDEWSLSHPKDVRSIAASYIAAGSDMIKTNSFGASWFKLKMFGLESQVKEINRAAASLSREAAGDKLVIASVGPTGKMLLMGDVSEQELYDAFAEQITALEEGGADGVCIETMSDMQEASLAIRAAKENTQLEIISTFTFNRSKQGDYRTMMGTEPVQAAQAALDAGADMIGANCGDGILQMTDVVWLLKKAFPKEFIAIHANAGLPQNIDGMDVFSDTPEIMAKQLPTLLDAGANIVGGCCGTTPNHIQAMRAIIDDIRS